MDDHAGGGNHRLNRGSPLPPACRDNRADKPFLADGLAVFGLCSDPCYNIPRDISHNGAADLRNEPGDLLSLEQLLHLGDSSHKLMLGFHAEGGEINPAAAINHSQRF